MKNTLKNIIVSISIVFLVFTLSYTLIYKSYETELIRIFEENPNLFYLEETIGFNEYRIIATNTIIDTLDTYLNLFILSTCIGTLIGLFRSVKELSIVKYILFFIFGYLLYSIIWTEFVVIVNKYVGNTYFNRFDLFMSVFPIISVSFILLYSATVAGIIFNNKHQVKELNENLKQPKPVKDSLLKRFHFKKIIISIFVIALFIFIFVIARKTIILINYSKKMNELYNCENYYYKVTSESSNYTNSYERWRKDGIILYKTNNYINYFDLNTKEGFRYNLEDNTISKFEKRNFEISITYNPFFVFENIFFLDTTVTFWRTFFLSFEVNINEEIYNGTRCYVITHNGTQLYLDKNTYLPLQKIEQYNYENKNIENYYYEFGNVTDSDVANPISD